MVNARTRARIWLYMVYALLLIGLVYLIVTMRVNLH